MNTPSPEPPSGAAVRLAQDLARGTSDLPILPAAAAMALTLATTPTVDPCAVIDAAGRDPPLAARLVGLAGQAHDGRTLPIASLRSAVATLGPYGLRDALYMAAYASSVFQVPVYQDLVTELFRHSVVVAHAARRLARRTGEDGDVAFLAGLLHDVGRARCLRIAARWATPGEPLDAVLAATDALHTQAGAALAIAWRLPDPVAEVCAWHHCPGERPMARLVAAAEALAHAACRGHAGPDETLFRALGALDLGPFDADPLLSNLLAEAA